MVHQVLLSICQLHRVHLSDEFLVKFKASFFAAVLSDRSFRHMSYKKSTLDWPCGTKSTSLSATD